MDILILKVLNMLQGERSLNGAIHILKGKRSAQTIQDISIYNLEKWAAALKQYNYNELRKTGAELYNLNLIKDQGKKTIITKEGHRVLKAAENTLDAVQFQGRKYEWNNEAERFWRRFSLLIQTVSCIKAGNYKFIPVAAEYDDKKIVKQLMKSSNAVDIAQGLEQWLLGILSKCERKDAELFVSRLSGQNHHGATLAQLTDQENDLLVVYLRFRSVIHRLIDEKNLAPQEFSQLFPPENSLDMLTKSAKDTRPYVMRGCTKEIIADSRSLKTSTIEDHLVELAMYDDNFPYKLFLADTDMHKILKVVEENNQLPGLKMIREELNQEVNYFDIRLVLALKYNWKEKEHAE